MADNNTQKKINQRHLDTTWIKGGVGIPSPVLAAVDFATMVMMFDGLGPPSDDEGNEMEIVEISSDEERPEVIEVSSDSESEWLPEDQ